MKIKQQTILLLATSMLSIAAISLPARSQSPGTQPTDSGIALPAHGRSVEVCFVLDTTGSMGGLIEGAKRKIWSIANSIATAEKGASVRFALVAYRDRGDDYITRMYELTDDLDKVFADLQTFQAGGGGDGPESVNQALNDAVEKVKWSAAPDVTKLIFLVGDAPPHMDYPDDVKFPQSCERAVRKGLIINTVQCGSIEGTRDIWEKIARLGEGSYVALEQSGNMITVETPVDKEIADLSAKIAATGVPYGSEKQQLAVAQKQLRASEAPASVAADRAAYNALGGKAVQGRGDLVSDVREKVVKLDDVKTEELPKELQSMTPEQRAAHLDKLASEREALNKQVAELSVKRQTYIDEQLKKQTGKGDTFDEKVTQIVKEQTSRKR